MLRQVGDEMSKKHIHALTRGKPPSVTLACAVAVGLFFTWFEMAFRAVAPLDALRGSTGWPFLERSDVAWVASLVVGTACALGARALLGAPAVARRATGRVDVAVALRGAGGRAWHLLGLAGGALATGGTALAMAAPGLAWAQLAGGALCGAGMAALLASWLPATRRFAADEALLVVLASILVSMAATTAATALVRPWALALLAACPLLASACAWLAARLDARPGAAGERRAHVAPTAPTASGGQDGEASERVRLFDPQGVVSLMAVFVSFLVLGIVGADMDMTLGSSVYGYANVAGLVNVAVLALPLLAPRRMRPGATLTLIAAGAVAVMPLSLAFWGEGPCFVLTKAASFCAYGLTMLRLVDDVASLDALAGDAAPNPLGDVRRGLARLGLLGLAMLVGVLAGDAVCRAVEPDRVGEVFPLVAVLLLYLVLAVYVTFAAGGSRRVVHVITGSFNDEAELARVRRDALLADHPGVSARESDVLLLLLQDFGTQRIAAELCVSENTVKTHVRHLYAKLGVGSRQQLLALARSEVPFRPGR